MAISPPPTILNLPFLVAIHTKSYQLPFNSCWNVCVFHSLPPNTNYITHCTLEFANQFILHSRHSPGINLRWFLLNSSSIPGPPLLLSRTHSHVVSSLPCMCSHTFTLFWSWKTSVIIKMFQLSFCVFVCAFNFLVRVSSFFSYFLC